MSSSGSLLINGNDVLTCLIKVYKFDDPVPNIHGGVAACYKLITKLYLQLYGSKDLFLPV